ncbi:arogenate dehydratase/prephenate dehydratase 6, chloroplastic-like [Solanum pennellii]|uniref:arogenate dehydratase n=1 Tax=Solanum pennellii TaxID=28526 RepID=A0ABM1UWC1_SOLPN|nr:arogenate dehydratase/prephenate dehydratase 6, chloroplastic-like [Solanum pennellii]
MTAKYQHITISMDPVIHHVAHSASTIAKIVHIHIHVIMESLHLWTSPFHQQPYLVDIPSLSWFQLPVHHCLLALPGVRKEYLNRVISHPQALAQCELTLTKLGLNVTREAVDDTAGAAEYIASHNLRDTAAIASARAADLYGLQISAEGFQDDSSNVTRFVMLAREPIIPRTDRPFKTSIVFAHDKGTSVLFKVLSAFAFRNISLTKIEPRPHRNRPIRLVDDANVGTAKHFEYMFYVDFEASMADVRAQNAFAEVQEFTSFLRVLGSYPMDMTPWCPSRLIFFFSTNCVLP